MTNAEIECRALLNECVTCYLPREARDLRERILAALRRPIEPIRDRRWVRLVPRYPNGAIDG